MLSHTHMGIPFKYTRMGRPICIWASHMSIRVWDDPYTYGPTYAYRGEHSLPYNGLFSKEFISKSTTPSKIKLFESKSQIELCFVVGATQH